MRLDLHKKHILAEIGPTTFSLSHSNWGKVVPAYRTTQLMLLQRKYTLVLLKHKQVMETVLQIYWLKNRVFILSPGLLGAFHMLK